MALPSALPARQPGLAAASAMLMGIDSLFQSPGDASSRSATTGRLDFPYENLPRRWWRDAKSERC
jgi:hypothetical protein